MLIEIVVAIGIVAVVLLTTVTGLLSSNREAAAYRALTAARLIVERNIERALLVSYTDETTPPILSLTSPDGETFDDDGNGDGFVNILVQNADGTNVLLRGTLTRIVQAEPNPQGAPVRRVTFRLNFDFRSRSYATEMTTFRAVDDF